MIKQRLNAIEYIRGISMLGVIGIHTGSQYLLNPTCNIHLVALLEIFTRFSVPIFFFISAFGLFYNLDINKPLNYRRFMTRRCKTVLIPYLVWSMAYLLYYAVCYGDNSFLRPFALLKTLFFGLASYQLYFLVILMWFYLLMPLWIYMLKCSNTLFILFLLAAQIAFNYYSSYILHADTTSWLLNCFIEYRLNYIVLHYLFIFLLGGWCALKFERFNQFMRQQQHSLMAAFFITMSAMLAHYYYLIYSCDYSPLSAINTVHQLSPIGIFYTIAASLFLFSYCTYGKITQPLHRLLKFCGYHSYFAYLVHPFVIIYAIHFTGWLGFVMTAPVTLAFFCSVVAISLLLAAVCRQIGQKLPLINKLTIGVSPKIK